MRKFLQYSVHLFVRPRVALRALLDDPKSLGFGFLGPVALAAVYFFRISIALAMNAMHLPQSPVLKIPAEQYYAYERFFILPVGLAGIILASGVIRLFAQGWNGQGRFEDLFTLLGFGQIVVAVVMGLRGQGGRAPFVGKKHRACLDGPRSERGGSVHFHSMIYRFR